MLRQHNDARIPAISTRGSFRQDKSTLSWQPDVSNLGTGSVRSGKMAMLQGRPGQSRIIVFADDPGVFALPACATGAPPRATHASQPTRASTPKSPDEFFWKGRKCADYVRERRTWQGDEGHSTPERTDSGGAENGLGHWWVTDAAQSSGPPGPHNKPSSSAGGAGRVYKRQLRVVHFTHSLSNSVLPAKSVCGHDGQIV